MGALVMLIANPTRQRSSPANRKGARRLIRSDHMAHHITTTTTRGEVGTSDTEDRENDALATRYGGTVSSCENVVLNPNLVSICDQSKYMRWILNTYPLMIELYSSTSAFCSWIF